VCCSFKVSHLLSRSVINVFLKSGKSTLLKLICGENAPTEGNMSTRSGLSIGRFHQHSAEVLDLEKSPVDYISGKYQDKYPSNRLEEWRAVVGNYGTAESIHGSVE